MIKVIVINGQGGSGKDTFVNLFEKCVQNTFDGFSERYLVKSFSSVGEIKELAKEYFHWDGSKDEASRKLLSDLKVLQTEYCNGPLNYMLDQLQTTIELNSDKKIFIFFHIREPSEIKNFLEQIIPSHGATSLLITRGEQKIYGNIGDDEVFNYKYNYIINNNGTLNDLYYQAKSFLSSILKE